MQGSDVVDEAMTKMIRENVPFAAQLGLEVLEGGSGRVVTRGEWGPERTTTGGSLHGGYIMAAADTTAATCAFLNLPEGAIGTATIESKTNFLGALRSGAITFTAEPVHVGRSTIVVQTDARDDEDRLISRTLQTQSVLLPR